MRHALTAVAVAGAADNIVFVVQRRALLRSKPGRVMGGVVGVGLWSGLAVASARSGPHSTPARSLAGAAVLLNGAVLALHLRARIVSPRVLAAGALAGAAGVLAVTG